MNKKLVTYSGLMILTIIGFIILIQYCVNRKIDRTLYADQYIVISTDHTYPSIEYDTVGNITVSTRNNGRHDSTFKDINLAFSVDSQANGIVVLDSGTSPTRNKTILNLNTGKSLSIATMESIRYGDTLYVSTPSIFNSPEPAPGDGVNTSVVQIDMQTGKQTILRRADRTTTYLLDKDFAKNTGGNPRLVVHKTIWKPEDLQNRTGYYNGVTTVETIQIQE